VSTLRSALEELRGEDLTFVGDEELVADLDELERASRAIEAERCRRLVELERRGAFAREGFLSLTAWVIARHRVPASSAARRLRLARVLERMPLVAASLASGEIDPAAAGLLASARQMCPEAFAELEGVLVDAARALGLGDLRRVVERFRQAADAERAELAEDRRYARRGLYVSPTLDGMVRVDGDLDAETGQALISALRAVMDTEARGRAGPDRRTPAQRRADALGEICRAWLDRSDRPTVAGERPHVVVTVDLEALRGLPGAAELEDAGPITPEAARRLACDARVSRVITGPGSRPLEVGRSSRVVPPALRRALVVRDRGCRFPGCGRPPGWCDAHHVVHWADGGETGLGNLVLLCRSHHRLIHRGFRVRMADGVPVFAGPDGSPLADRGPP
jgi:hypothetical protein